MATRAKISILPTKCGIETVDSVFVDANPAVEVSMLTQYAKSAAREECQGLGTHYNPSDSGRKTTRTAWIHPYVNGQVAQSRFPNLPSHPTLSWEPSPLVSGAPYQLSCRSSSNTVSVVHILSACVPTPEIPLSAHAPTHKPHSR